MRSVHMKEYYDVVPYDCTEDRHGVGKVPEKKCELLLF